MESIAKRRQTLAIALLSSIFSLPLSASLYILFFPFRSIRSRLTLHPSLCLYTVVSIAHNISGHKSKIHAPNDIRWWRMEYCAQQWFTFLIWFSSNYYVTHISIHHNERACHSNRNDAAQWQKQKQNNNGEINSPISFFDMQGIHK